MREAVGRVVGDGSHRSFKPSEDGHGHRAAERNRKLTAGAQNSMPPDEELPGNIQAVVRAARARCCPWSGGRMRRGPCSPPKWIFKSKETRNLQPHLRIEGPSKNEDIPPEKNREIRNFTSGLKN